MSFANPFRRRRRTSVRRQMPLTCLRLSRGRRPSKLLLVNRLRKEVDAWRGPYVGASSVTRRLFEFWFDDDHEVGGKLFHYYFGQREAIETLAYLFEIREIRDARAQVELFGEVFQPEATPMVLPGMDIEHETTTDGRRRIRRFIPELGGATVQELPEEGLARYAFKMATGSGKTVVMAMAAVWSYSHRRRVPGSQAATNFLVVAPNVIVFQRLEKDFGSGRIFTDYPLIPPEWLADWHLKVIVRGEATEPSTSGNLFLTNIHQLYTSREPAWTPANAVDAILGRKPLADLAGTERSMLERLRGLGELMVINDEAHHVHDPELKWHESLASLHHSIPGGLAMWLDFSATPKDQNGTYFPWIVCDYPLAQAVEDRIVKAPLIVHRVEHSDPEHVTRENVIEQYGDWLLAALARWREHQKSYEPLGVKPVLFIMAEKNLFADAIGKWLVEGAGVGLTKEEVLVIHTDSSGDVRESQLEVAREAARDIDETSNSVKVVVSVLMLREGWDVRGVTVVLGLRPFTSDAKILPEQAVGRGLRLMLGIGPDHTQTLEVMGTQAFEAFVRELEKEGLGVKTVSQPPPPPVKIYPVAEKAARDIAIPMTGPAYERNYRLLDELDPRALDPIFERVEVDEPTRIRLKMASATIGTEVHQVDIAGKIARSGPELLAQITNQVMERARLTGAFSHLYPFVRDYVTKRCFGREVGIETDSVRSHLELPSLREGIAQYLAQEVGKTSVEVRPFELEKKSLKLAATQEFTWRRNLPLLDCSKTIFNLVATYNDFEKEFARFLDKAADVDRFAALGTTEQDSGSQFRVNYVKPSGAIGYYHPDWIVVQRIGPAEDNWVVETKGRVWESTASKDAAMDHWCKQVAELTGARWHYKRIDQVPFNRRRPRLFADLVSVEA